MPCKWATSIDGSIKYQWPRIIAVQAPPRSAAEVKKLATVNTCIPSGVPLETSRACNIRAIKPLRVAVQRSTGRSFGHIRPTISLNDKTARKHTTNANVEKVDNPEAKSYGDLNANPISNNVRTRTALKRKNLTPASFDTNSKVRMMPIPRWVRKRSKTAVNDIRSGKG